MENQMPEEELLKEFEWAKEHIPDSAVPQCPPDEEEKVIERVEKERRR